MEDEITIRPIDFARDMQPLKMFLNERDKLRLEHSEAAVRDGDCFVFVADERGLPVGWIAGHTTYRTDQDWEPDDDTKRFQEGENAYLEHIEVAARARSQGTGRKLIAAAEAEAKRRGKQRLWLHTSENNEMAHRLFEREGWQHERSVTPQWKPGVRMRIYCKDI